MVAWPSGRREKGIHARFKRLKRRYSNGLKTVLPLKAVPAWEITKIRDYRSARVLRPTVYTQN
jgi:hypothetical protein